MTRRLVACGLMALGLLAGCSAAHPSAAGGAVPHVVDLAVGNARQRLLYLAPPDPRATIIMLPGGAGDIGIRRDGTLRHGANFLVRTRMMWVRRGFAVVIPDAVDHRNLRGLRHTEAYGAIVARLVDFARSRSRRPVFLMGTSQGSIAAVNGAAHARRRSISGVILTESVSVLGHSHETVFDAGPGLIHVPALVVANRDDLCFVAPPSMAPRIAAALSGSRAVAVLHVSGGVQRGGNACGSLSPHGYDGIEPLVVDDIVRWIDGVLKVP